MYAFQIAVVLDARLLLPDNGYRMAYMPIRMRVREILEACASPKAPHQSQLWCARYHMDYATTALE